MMAWPKLSEPRSLIQERSHRRSAAKPISAAAARNPTEKSSGWPRHVDRSGDRAGENRQARQTLDEIERDRGGREPRAKRRAEEKHDERLQRQRHQIEGNLNLGRNGKEERSAEREREALPDPFRRRPNGGWRRAKSSWECPVRLGAKRPFATLPEAGYHDKAASRRRGRNSEERAMADDENESRFSLPRASRRRAL